MDAHIPLISIPLENMGEAKLSGDLTVGVSTRRSKSLVIEDENTIPMEYISMTPKVDKKAIAAAIKNGEVIEGCHLKENINIILK